MSIDYALKDYVIVCDVCCDGPKEKFHNEESAQTYMKENHWVSVQYAEIDICPICLQEKQAS